MYHDFSRCAIISYFKGEGHQLWTPSTRHPAGNHHCYQGGGTSRVLIEYRDPCDASQGSVTPWGPLYTKFQLSLAPNIMVHNNLVPNRLYTCLDESGRFKSSPEGPTCQRGVKVECSSQTQAIQKRLCKMRHKGACRQVSQEQDFQQAQQQKASLQHESCT